MAEDTGAVERLIREAEERNARVAGLVAILRIYSDALHAVRGGTRDPAAVAADALDRAAVVAGERL